MNWEINKNIDEMNKSFITSKKPYQIVCIILSFVIGIAVMLILKDFIGVTVSSYLCIFIVLPLGVLGVYERNGLDFITYVRKKKSNVLQGKLVYRREDISKVASPGRRKHAGSLGKIQKNR